VHVSYFEQVRGGPQRVSSLPGAPPQGPTAPARPSWPALSCAPELDEVLGQAAAVAFGISGGKDGELAVLQTLPYLDRIGHTGPRVLIHADLGRIEWEDSLAACERLAAHVGLPLLVVRRQAGDLVDRWTARWAGNVARYAELRCVRVILPWSTAALRFCTSELKVAVICRELVQRFPGRSIVSVTGVRREESAARARALVWNRQPRLESATRHTRGFDWRPVLDWTRADVFARLVELGRPLHAAYATYGSSRVSCAFCILSSQADLHAATTAPANAAVYRELVALEVRSTFAFQGGHWLGDVAPGLLGPDLQAAVARAKLRAAAREQAEARIPRGLLYTAGWPTRVPSREEAGLLGEVRRAVAEALEISVRYTTAADIQDRYAELMAARTEPVAAEQLGFDVFWAA
jgi:3'-phosphoadenosine 5'-phosphosulfate sulfotransferase (PAPS reductase)/FAD synthetase